MISKGLLLNLLVDDFSQSFMVKGFDVMMVGYMVELLYLMRLVSVSVQVVEMGNQSVNFMVLVVGWYVMEGVEILGLMCVIYMWVLFQVVDLRVVQMRFREEVKFWLLSLVRDYVFGGSGFGRVEVIERVVGQLGDIILQRWDEFVYLDLRERCDKVVKELMGWLLDDE